MQHIIHKVVAQDTPESISSKYGVPFGTITKDNGHEQFFAGLRLIIRKQKGLTYHVKPFDTLTSISKKFNIPTSALSSFNHNIQQVFFGQIIYIPENDQLNPFD